MQMQDRDMIIVTKAVLAARQLIDEMGRQDGINNVPTKETLSLHYEAIDEAAYILFNLVDDLDKAMPPPWRTRRPNGRL